MLKRLLAIGDVHGCFSMFQDLWQKLQFNPKEDIAIFLGDYIDRGPECVQMIEWVLQHVQEKSILFLRGNHEVMMYNSFRLKPEIVKQVYESVDSPKILWLANGGNKTMSSLSKSGRLMEFLPKWLDTIGQMNSYAKIDVDGQIYFFAHAGIDLNRSLDDQQMEDLYWSRKLAKQPELYKGDAVLIFGHTPVQALDNDLIDHPVPQFHQQGKLILMDTGSYIPHGRISAVDVLTGQIWQSRPNKTEFT